MATMTAARARHRVLTDGALVGWTAGIALLWSSGLSVDVWYHLHRGFLIESFLTPAHALMYGGMMLAGVPALLYLLDSLRLGVPVAQRLPTGFALALAGWALYGMGGLFDYVWHSAVGFEASYDAVLSPSHVWLALAFTLFAVGLLRGALAWRRTSAPSQGFLRPADLPIVVTLALLLRSMVWYLTYTSPLTSDFAAGGASTRALDGYAGIAWTNLAGHMAGATGIFFEAALVSLMLMVATRQLHVPGGGVAVMLTLYALLIAVSTSQWLAFAAVLVGAVTAELIWASVRGRESAAGYWLLGGAVPLVQTAVYLALAGTLGGGLVWTPHLWVGVPIVAGIYGLMATVLSQPRALLGISAR